jgi:hypothetical protein
MSSKKHIVFCVILAVIMGPIFAYQEFPITKAINFEILPPYIKALHEELSKSACPITVGDRGNYFSCAFIFWVSSYKNGDRKDKIEGPILSMVSMPKISTVLPVKKTKEELDKLLLTSASRWGHRPNSPQMQSLTRTITTPSPKEKKPTSSSSSAILPAVINEINLSKDTFLPDRNVFISTPEIPLFCLSCEYEILIKPLIVATKALIFAQDEVPIITRLFFSTYDVIFSRSQPLRREIEQYRVFNSDSEAHAIYVLSQQEVIDKIFENLNLAPDDEITQIEFHGCSTRDMCPLCYTNMNCIQFLANQEDNQGIGFLSKMLVMSQVSKNCRTTMFISSLIPYPEINPLWVGNASEEAKIKQLWIEDTVDGAINFGRVYQFRVPPQLSSVVITKPVPHKD